MMSALVVPFVAVPLYFANVGNSDADNDDEGLEGGGNRTLREKDAWILVGGVSVGWLVLFAVFLACMKKKYRKTFWSTQTGTQ